MDGGAEYVVEVFFLVLDMEPLDFEELCFVCGVRGCFVACDCAVAHGKAGGELFFVVKDF